MSSPPSLLRFDKMNLFGQDVAVDTPAEGSGNLTDKADTLAVGEEQMSVNRKKPLSFYMAFCCLLIMVLLVSVDSTCMAVSISVSNDHKRLWR